MDTFSYLGKLRQTSPLIHNMTNQVVANFAANGLLALGASPIMAYAIEEIEEIVSICNATALNIGTITPDVFNSMLLAGKTANTLNHPLIFDPVGVGASQYRKACADQLLHETQMTLIRGNGGEIATLCNIEWQAKGVDSGEGDYDLQSLALEASQELNCIVAISGETDWISDGNQVIGVQNGKVLMTKVTGMGCLLTAVSAAFLAIDESMESVVAAHALYGAAGDKAFLRSQSPASFQVHFLDELHCLSSEDNQYIKLVYPH